MLILLALIYALPVYLVFFHFGWLRLNSFWWTVIISPPVIAGFFLWFAVGHYTPITADAYVQAFVVQLTPQVSGNVTEVLVGENERVTSGATLFRIDQRPFAYQVGQLTAQLVSTQEQTAGSLAGLGASQLSMLGAEWQVIAAQRSLQAARATAQATSDTIRSLEAQTEYAVGQRARNKVLLESQTISQRDFDLSDAQANALIAQTSAARQQALQTQASEALAESQLATAVTTAWEARAKYLQTQILIYPLRALDAAISATEQVVSGRRKSASETGVSSDSLLAVMPPVAQRDHEDELMFSEGLKSRLARRIPAFGYELPPERVAAEALNTALFNLEQTSVAAPATGTVSHLQLSPGAYARAGSPLLSFIDESKWWLVANYPENWLEKIKAGDSVLFSLRNYPGRVRLAKVESVSRGVYQGQGIPNGNLADAHPRITRQFDTPRDDQRFQVIVKLADDSAAEPLRVGATGRAVVLASGGLPGLNGLMTIVVYLFSYLDFLFPKPSPVLILAVVAAIAGVIVYRKRRAQPAVTPPPPAS